MLQKYLVSFVKLSIFFIQVLDFDNWHPLNAERIICILKSLCILRGQDFVMKYSSVMGVQMTSGDYC